MNNLVAYGEDSDEDSPRRRSTDVTMTDADAVASPRPRRDSDMFFEEADVQKEESPRSERSSQSGKSETMDFVEPPPPPRRPTDAHSPSPAVRTPKGMLKVSSVCSLVSYGKDEAEFDKAELEGHRDDRQSPPSGAEEPRPPARISQDSESEGEEEQLIEQANEDIHALKEQQAESSTPGSMTPARDTDSPQVLPGDSKMEDDLVLPPSPPGECDPNLQRKFEMFFEKKALGNNFNAQLQSMSGFLNPSCYESFIEQYDLKEKGSNFDPSVFDPFCYPENCFYDAIAEEQRKLMETAQAKAAKKGHPSTR